MQYDHNAIRVDNVRREQIGHIPRQIAAKLARYMVLEDLNCPLSVAVADSL